MTDTRGILHPQRAFEHFQLHRFPAGETLGPYVDRFWCVSWDLPPGESFEQPVLAHPVVNVVVEPGRGAVYGPTSRLGRQHLSGAGWAVAAMFRPGAARPFLDAALREWVDRVVPIDRLGAAGAGLADRISQVPGSSDEVDRSRADLLRSFMAGLAPSAVPADVQDAVAASELIASDRTLCRVEDLVARTGIETRSLQRLFRECVGFPPKRVIRRYRLLEAAEAASEGRPVAWADVARSLGFSDQAHLTRDFTAAFGVSPARYAGG
ncbi:Helix-turn-helix domain-containing protein [Nakamurella panacisegetis]|uniref:Helix-turn-helix domain-containing protein n=1 Tax=Nakamurella panacisegetis TaxID=1090615 RepID=A0A1H0J9K4_9ACTN|nr:helix-turn-helix domain-containing protein [Nakamurella panacisegetis]SDO40282.1 Helix-turn-helix domain-containing protein [Nakamurella panacisegetis]